MDHDRPRLNPLAAVGWTGVLVLGVVVCMRAMSFPLNHDVGWWLHVSRSMLAGEVLYRDLIEIGPPMTAYVSMIPVWVSQVSGLRIGTASTLCTLVLLLGVTAWSMALARRPGAPQHDLQIIGAAILVTAGLLPGSDFTQREHLMFMLILPYTLVLWRRAMGRQVSLPCALGAGLAAGVGLALKPHFILIPLALEVVSYLEMGVGGRRYWRRLRTAERFTVLAVLTAYGLSVLLRGEYLFLLAMTAELYADFASASRMQLVASVHTIVLIACLPAVIRARSELGQLARFLVGIGFASLVLAVLQGKGWSYQFYPALAATTGAVVLIAYDFAVQAWQAPERVRLWDGATLVLAAAITLVAAGSWMEGQQRAAAGRTLMLHEQVQYLADIQPNGSLLIMSAFPSQSFPLVNYSGLEWASPFPALWWIRARHARWRKGTAEQRVMDLAIENPTELELTRMLVARFRQATPGIVLVDTAAQDEFGGARFPYVKYLEQNEDFRREWRNYVKEGEIGPFAVWLRRPKKDPVRRPAGDHAP